jgi:N-acetylneuraminic acid mutarotase
MKTIFIVKLQSMFFIFYGLLILLIAKNSCSQESWSQTSYINAPSPRTLHSAVWTGSLMIVWGGQSNFHDVNTGSCYNPSANSWTSTSTTNAPLVRELHTAVWTGTKMIIWGGWSIDSAVWGCNTGGMYDPVTNTWTPTSTINAPTGRIHHTAVWTGSKMIVWGGSDDVTGRTNTGGIYDPVTNTWTSVSLTNAPSAREWHTAVWTGSKMIILGGDTLQFAYSNTGGIYDPVQNSWTRTSTTNAPAPRMEHTAVWTGSKMIVWGGTGNNIGNTGGVYDPSANSWLPTSVTNAPSRRIVPTAIWTGIRMVIWGGDGSSAGLLNTGGIYDAVTDSWVPTTTLNAPLGRASHTAVWTGSKMIVWGGATVYGSTNSGGIYSNPSIIGINQISNEVPEKYELYQNYPNPFNPKTKIKFSLSHPSKGGEQMVKLQVYDILGREIAQLFPSPGGGQEGLSPGTYEVEFDGSNYPSGIYLYKLSSEGYSETKRMALIK